MENQKRYNVRAWIDDGDRIIGGIIDVDFFNFEDAMSFLDGFFNPNKTGVAKIYLDGKKIKNILKHSNGRTVESI